MDDITWIDDIINNHQKSKNKLYKQFLVLNDFNTHRSKIKNKVPNLVDDDFCFSSNNNIDLNETNKTEQINLSQNYKRELNEYNKALAQNNNEINNKINPNNDINYYKKEINTIRQEIILLKSKISENELIINDYKNTINVLKSKHTEELNDLNNHINILNDYILLIYQFFNDISKKYLPQLNFNYDSNQNQFKLIDINEFNNKLKVIDNYIFNLNNNQIHFKKSQNLNNNNKANNFKNFEKINSNEEKIRMEKEDKKYDMIKNFNNDFIIQKLKEDSNNLYDDDDYLENNNLGVIQLYKNLENKFDILEKAIEEGKKNKYDFMIEENKENNLKSNDIILTNISNNFEYEKNNLLEELYRNEKIIQNKTEKEKKNSKKKKKPLTIMNLNNNLRNKKGFRKMDVSEEQSKNKKNSKNNLKNKK